MRTKINIKDLVKGVDVPLAPEEMALMVRLIDTTKLTDYAIAQRTGITPQTVKNWRSTEHRIIQLLRARLRYSIRAHAIQHNRTLANGLKAVDEILTNTLMHTAEGREALESLSYEESNLYRDYLQATKKQDEINNES